MSKFLRTTAVAATVAAFAFTAAPAAAAPVQATTEANAYAKIMVPLTLEGTQDLDFGTLVISGTGSQLMSIDQATGALAGCGAVITCSATQAQTAVYKVTGTPNATVTVSVASPVTMTNANDGSTLDLTPDAPATVTLDAAAATATGDLFNIGGSITIDSTTTTDGLYSGTFDVSVDYQ